MPSNQMDCYMFKIIVVGNSGVGKTCYLSRFINDDFTPSFIPTVGIDFMIRNISIDGKIVRLNVWDVAGQEKFKTITDAYYQGAVGAFLVYDITDERSFNGNKCDLEESRTVSREQGQALADTLGISFLEVSAKSDIKIDEAFNSLAINIKKHMDNRSRVAS
ncbi:GTP-binding protein [Conoideocrella luteorostrata]|uniref:GTP-binding protein n=1 Tax=Conoideocrella luteorostrata TaxID=1105319 RepID=A0AAJ0FYF0_9HYPO|nr:GTP-binding protein [Conoideocrella luteorostrata]